MNTLELRQFLLVGLLLVSSGCASQKRTGEDGGAGPAPARMHLDPARANARITGKVAFEGTAPAPVPLKLTADPACVAMHREPLYSEEIVVRDARLQNVFVWVKQGLEKYSFDTPAEPVTLTQQGCRYSPHVGGLMVNQKLRIVNADDTSHNIQCMAENNVRFNIGQAVRWMSTDRSFEVPEVMVRFKCNVHNWMTCYFGVVPHPYFSVTGTDGTYALRNLPAGDYIVEAWHEKLGTKTQKITLRDNEAREMDFTFSAHL